jgi:hypothetical protein
MGWYLITELGTERVGVILRRCTTGIVEGWLARAKQSDLSVVPLSDEQLSTCS